MEDIEDDAKFEQTACAAQIETCMVATTLAAASAYDYVSDTHLLSEHCCTSRGFRNSLCSFYFAEKKVYLDLTLTMLVPSTLNV